MDELDINYMDMTCKEFVEVLSSAAPIPGGGGSAALAGALGSALAKMVANLTQGKSKYADVQDEIQEIIIYTCELQDELLSLIKADALAFLPLSCAYKMPVATEQERELKAQAMQVALVEACKTPLLIMKKCGQVIDVHGRLANIGSTLAISDVGAGVIIAGAAMQAASLNIFINTSSLDDRALATDLNTQAHELLDMYVGKSRELFKDIQARFNTA